MNQQSGSLDNVCCSTSANPLPLGSGGPAPSNNFQGQQQRPAFQQQQPQRNNNNNFNSPASSQSLPTGSCPNVGALPDISSCNGATSNCWSVGQADVDCPNNELCCFDGCRNACYFGGECMKVDLPHCTFPKRDLLHL